MKNKEFEKYKQTAEKICDKSNEIRSFIDPELLTYDYDYIKKIVNNNKELKKYSLVLERLFRYKDHTLSEKEEKILSNVEEVLRIPSNTYDILDNVDVNFGKIKDENGNKVKLTNSNYSNFIKSNNENVRKSAFNTLYKFYKNNINTISSLYLGELKCNKFIKESRKYNRIIDMYLYSDKIDTKLYTNLIKITNNNLNILNKYYDIKSKSLNKKLHMYDLYVDVSKNIEKSIPYEDGLKIINEALKPLGKEYLDNFNYLINNNSVDVYPKEFKRSGAYEWGCYNKEPYVSINYEDNIDSVSTLAHEMGHAMHTFYSNKYQDYEYANYPIFLAEIASTVNEILLSNYLIENTKNKDEKISYIIEFLDKFKATVYRQVMFAEFEYNIHDKFENNITITTEVLNKEYLKLNKKHFKNIVIDKNIQYEWARIPHFYTPFYVYKYATGFISALVIVDNLINDESFKDKYINFLKSGSSNYPLELLKKLGIDITNEKTLNKSFEVFEKYVNLLEKNINEKGV